MGIYSVLFFLSLFALIFQLSESATILVDGISEWKNPQVQIGDSVIFQHKYQYKLYIFKNQKDFSLCNFTKATLLTKANSTSYTWHASRPGFFYFSFNNGSDRACLEGQRFAVKVTPPPPPTHAASPESPPSKSAPPLTPGGVVASSPAFPWPFQPRESASPSPSPGLVIPASSPMALAPDKEGSGIPFISSNPAVPLPIGEVDSATIRPLPTSGHRDFKQVVGLGSAAMRALNGVVFPIMMMMMMM